MRDLFAPTTGSVAALNHRLIAVTLSESLKKEPEILVQTTFDDWNSGRDPVLDRVLAEKLPGSTPR